MAQQVTLTIPPGGSLGVCIQRNNAGQCFVASKNGNASALCVGDVILSMNGIVLASVDGGLQAWKKLFLAFVSVPRKLVVQRGPLLQQNASVKNEPQPETVGSSMIGNYIPPPNAQPSAVKSNVSVNPTPSAQPGPPAINLQHAPLPSSGLPTLHRPQMQHAPPQQPPAKLPPPPTATATRDSIALMAMELAKSSKPSVATTAAYAKVQQMAQYSQSKPNAASAAAYARAHQQLAQYYPQSSKPNAASAAAYARAQQQLANSSKQLAATLAKTQQKKKHALKPSSHGNTTTSSNKKAKKSTSGRKEWNHDDNYMKMMRDGFRESSYTISHFHFFEDSS